MPSSVEAIPGVTETIHGIPVADPYRWLEERDSPATEDWLADQKTRFDSYFRRLGPLERLRNRVKEYLDVEVVDQVGKVGDLYFYRKRKAGEQQASLYVSSSDRADERRIVNPAPLGRFASVGIYRVSSDARLLAYELKQGGEHSKAVHVVDVATGKLLPDHLATGLARGFVFRNASDGFYYCHDLLDSDSANPRNDHLIRFHRLGTPQEEDRVLLKLPRTSSSKVVLDGDGTMLSAILYRKQAGQFLVDFVVADQSHHGSWSRIAQDLPAPFSPFFCRGALLALSYENAPNGKVVELSLNGCCPLRTIVPQWRSPIKRLTVAQDRIYVSYLVGTDAVVRVWSIKGDFLGAIPLETERTWAVLPTYTNETDEIFLTCESFTRPPTIFSFKTEQEHRTLWNVRNAPPLKPTIITRKLQYPSKDGTQIVISLVGPIDAPPGGTRPVIMTAYGGFGLTLTPQFSTFVSIMLECGFLFALPEIRGGEERGSDWHTAARRRNRQVAIDDFVAAAEWLCTEGITTPDKLAIFGESNSGLLVGAAVTQRPALFGAALCIAPLFDMIRYHRFDRAYVWAEEYGTADDPDDFEALHSYSPYHHISESCAYPAIMIVSGDKDTRCNPSHARKMAAALQNRPAQSSVVVLDYSSERGHAPTMPLSVRVDALAHRIAFVCHELEVATHREHFPPSLILSALFCLLRTESYLRRHKGRALQSLLRRTENSEGKRRRHTVTRICRSMDVACVLYFKEVKCLQRSVALAMMLRGYGWNAELVVGAQVIPPKFHAWVEMNRKVLNDKPYMQQLYRELERC